MICAFPFHKGDKDRAKKWLEWVAEMGGCRSHSILLMPAKDTDAGDLLPIARASWGSVDILPDGEGITGWPQGPNSNIRQLVWHMWAQHLGPVFHIENDCIPLVPDWLDQIAAEYQTALLAGRTFLGQVVRPSDSTPVHLTGNMVMPWDAAIQAPLLPQRCFATTGEELAFDITAAPQILPKAYDSKLIQQVWNENGQPPTFPVGLSLCGIKPGAVLFHRVKDGSLIDRLREKRTGSASHRDVKEEIAIFRETEVPEVEDAAWRKKESPKVYTYFAPVESEGGKAEQQRILAIWRAQWLANGWQPVVLTEEDAQRHPDYESLKAHFASLPTINRPGYEMACWLRWVAMAATGGGLMVDYDTLPFDFHPPIEVHGVPNYSVLPRILADNGPCPCSVFGTVDQFNSALFWFRENPDKCTGVESNHPHASDQIAVQSGEPWWTSDVCGQYEGAIDRKLIHFGHFSCHPRLRSEVMAQAVESRSTKVDSSPASIPPTMADRFRSMSSELAKLIDGNPGRKAQLQIALREAGLIGLAKKRAKRSNKKN